MPKFEKWSLEMKNYMAGLRAKRGEKSPIYTNKQVSKGHIKEIVNEALEIILSGINSSYWSTISSCQSW